MNSKEQIAEQINKLFESSKERALKVSYVLSQIDLGMDDSRAKFNFSSIVRLYLFKVIKGISTYYQIIEYLNTHEEEAFQLGFYKDENNTLEFPPKSTFNYYLESLDRKQLAEIAELILATATQHGIILDLEIVKKVIKEKKKNNDKEINEAIKLIRKLIYPQIDLKIKSNGKFTTTDLLDVLVHVAFSNDFVNNGSNTFKASMNSNAPSGDLMFYHFNKFDSIEKIRKMFEKISDFIFNFARNNYNVLKNRKHDIAYDIHKVPYYGKGILWACGDKPERGTSQFIEFLTCSIVVAGRRFVVDVVPIHPLDNTYALLDESLGRVRNKLRIERAYLDRGFNEVKIFQVLKKHKIKFLMPMIRNPSVKQAFDKAEYNDARVFKDFKVGEEPVNLVLVNDELGIKRAFVCNFDIAPCIAWRLYEMYSKRWGIESGYRNLDHDFQARTTTRNYHIRLFYFLFSTCLYNLWVLVNIVVSLTIYGRIRDKPLITAKLFAILLYRVKEGIT